MALREAPEELQLLEEADLAYCRVMLAHLLARLVELATPACHLQLPQLRNRAEHQAHPVEESQLLMLPVLGLLEVGR
jgi:hypothetical protein